MKIGLMGDTHQDFFHTEEAIRILAGAGVEKVLHVGDFGFGGDARGVNYLDSVHKWATAANLTIYVTPGNHEDYTYIKSVLQANKPNRFAPVRGGVKIIPRAHRWEWGGRSFVSLGGAGSVDRMWRLDLSARTGKTYWWAGEAIQPEDATAVISGGHADVMITHEAPYYKDVEERIKGNPLGFPEIDIQWSDMSRQVLHHAVYGIMPTLLVHGHHHFYAQSGRTWRSVDGPPGTMHSNDSIGYTRILSLNKELDTGSLAVLETDDLSIAMLN